MKASEMVRQAFVLPGVYGKGRTLDSFDAQLGLDLLNQMLAGWAIEGLDLDQPTLSASDELAIAAGYEWAVKVNLATILQGVFPTDGPNWGAEAERTKSVLLAAIQTEAAPDAEYDLAVLPRYRMDGDPF